MIKYDSKGLKLLIINYNYFENRDFKIKIKSGDYILLYYTTKLLFINTKHNTVMKVEYYSNNYFYCKINLDPKLNYSIIFNKLRSNRKFLK